ncbi:uncharacterized protein LAESUDRAFT_813862 [Laetiporus sulphureus 93-53]|uniref:BTB domain-containing protein n=1 Tax=Laetiporus sulphureus 93-53 TaxID=1314785 RepID=A0A165DJ83_9APHY|nr:uncharacterized protein LAESUDRAFT_813862 [Laetiporus sulphureus 93-53]KZT05002.1 hypothetical protein LAESUDRAFT_813862 [Laetiporus sulphureus 93-53]
MSLCAASTRTSSSEACTSHSTIRSSRFFFTDETVIFRVSDPQENKDHFYQVHRYFLQRDSEFFHGMFSCPPEDGGAEGKTEETAIFLPGATSYEMDCLLSFLYDGMYEHALCLEDWIALLSISTRFVFDKIRDRAIREISAHVPALDPVQRISLAVKHDIPEWLMTAYVELCTRPIPLSKKEVEELGPTTAARLARAREDLMGTRGEAPYRTGLSAIANAPLGACGCRSCRQARRESAISSALNNSKTVAAIIERAMSLSLS